MLKNNNIKKLRIRKRMVAIIAVLLALTLMTTISYNVSFVAFAEGEQTQQTETAGEQKEAAQNAQESTEQQTQTPAEGEAQAAGGTGDAAAAGATETPAPAEQQTGETAANSAAGDAAAAGEAAAEGAKPADGAKKEEKTEEPAPPPPVDSSGKPVMPEVTSSSYIVMSGSTSEVVIDQHAQRKMSPGRITLLMTAMVAIDNMYNDDELKNNIDITDKLAEYGTEFKAGETVTVGNLLDAMLVGGSGQAAEALSRYSASKRNIFIKMMNSKAMELGLMDTQFRNPSGAYSTKQYSTATDCAVITQAAMRYPEIVRSLSKINVEFTVKSADGERIAAFTNTNPLLTSEDPNKKYEYTKGGISGTMGDPVKATQFASVAVIDDMQLITILMDSKEDRIAYEARGLFEYGNTLVTRNAIIKAGKRTGIVRVRYGSETYVPAYTETQGFAYVPPEGSEELISTEIVLDKDLEAPLSKGAKVGEFRIFVADELKGTVNIVIKKDIPKGWYLSRIYISNKATIVLGVILFLILLLLLRILYVKAQDSQGEEGKKAQRACAPAAGNG